MNRPLTNAERCLTRWMLENSDSEVKSFLPQLEQAQATAWRCPCGCASVNFSIQGHTPPSGGLHVLADFVFGSKKDLAGIFVFEQSGVLAGLEVYGLAADAPKSLPLPESLRAFSKPE